MGVKYLFNYWYGVNSNNIFPLNLYFSTVGIVGWVIVGMLWRDRSIMILNAIAFSIYFNGIVKHLWENSMIVTEDHFIVEDDYVYAGKHLIVDIYGFDKSYKKFKLLLAKASELAGAKLLYHIHTSLMSGGVTGVAY